MKRLLSLLFAAALLLLLATPVLADGLPTTISGTDPVVDRADLLTFSEEAALRTSANDIELAHGCQVIIVTVDGLGGSSAQDYADRFFLNNGYGTGADRDGILLLVSMEDRDYHISTHGFAIDAFTDNGLLYLEDGFLSDLSDGNYYDAFRAYQDRAEDMLSYYDGSATPEEREEMEEAYESFAHKTPFAGISIGAAVLGFLGSLLPMSRLKKEVKTVHKQSNAGNYVRDNSLNVGVSRDIYLYANV
ncbi:MAG: TPM domain-containing protein, partial [Oscillospiraceae bacterium]|nr:TPM domain-containing protein [Oscillospiraceae bacterium]